MSTQAPSRSYEQLLEDFMLEDIESARAAVDRAFRAYHEAGYIEHMPELRAHVGTLETSFEAIKSEVSVRRNRARLLGR